MSISASMVLGGAAALLGAAGIATALIPSQPTRGETAASAPLRADPQADLLPPAADSAAYVGQWAHGAPHCSTRCDWASLFFNAHR
jgi:hypothetical protein